MYALDDRDNVELRGEDDEQVVVLAFPYDARIVAAVRTLPNRRFDWDAREWIAPAEEWVGARLIEILEMYPELSTSGEVDSWLRQIRRSWVGYIRATVYAAQGWFQLQTMAGALPPELRALATEHEGTVLLPFTKPVATGLTELGAARLSTAAARCLELIEFGEPVPPARLVLARGVDGERLNLEILWDASIAIDFERLPGATGNGLPFDPWLADELDAFVARHNVQVAPLAATVLDRLLAERREASAAVRRSRADSADPIPEVAAKLGGELAPFQWAGVRYVLDQRRTFLADEQGLGKTVEALAALEADEAFPAVVVCPAAMKLVWEREAAKWLPHRSTVVVQGRGGGQDAGAEIVIINYEVVEAHRQALARRRLRAVVVDEAHYCKNPRAKRTASVRRLAESVTGDGLRLALTGTPVMNHAEELVPQLRVIGRLADFGSGAQFRREFRGIHSEERLHWHLRRYCFIRRLKSEVLPQLPAKRRVVVPMGLTNTTEYRLAEQDVIEWLKTQPLSLDELDAKTSATLRAERLAQLTVLQRLAARGKLAAAIAWIDDFLESGEALVVFARHREVQRALIERHPDALHLLGDDPVDARQAAINAFQRPDGPPLIVCATRVAAMGITLTRASNVCFMELEWTPAMHDQAEDRCHRIGQHDAVTAWYLLAADTIDETMARLIQAKRELIDAVTDGRSPAADGLLQGVVRELREGTPFRHLRAIA